MGILVPQKKAIRSRILHVQAFPWKRFWCPRGDAFSLLDAGFLSDPESKSVGEVNRNLVTFAQMADTPALALLGEPGIGKTSAMEQERSLIVDSVMSEGGEVMWLDLRSYANEDRVMRDLFDAAQFRNWRSGSHILHVFLDSLDECLLRIDNVAALLADELPKQPVARLRFRIACRTAPWPSILEHSLITLFGNQGFRPYELVPLRRTDVRLAAEQRRIANPDAFINRLRELDVVPLAIKPVTLQFLISGFLRDGDFPTKHVELYEIGCKILCEETNESRRGSGRFGRLSPDERLMIAGRIAAVTQFANRYAIWTGAEGEDVPLEDVLLSDLAGGTEGTVNHLAVSSDSIREVLDTGLFSARGANRMGWAHQTYAEFLAARYCTQREMPAKQLQPLLFHPAKGGEKLVPQLQELAAWISVMNPGILTAVGEADPLALLGAAGAGLTGAQRKLVVQKLLEQTEAGRQLHLNPATFGLYRKLSHAHLAQQLRPFVIDSAKPFGSRFLAISICHACAVSELASDLADAALNLHEPRSLRVHAGFTAAEIGSAQEVRRRLGKLALDELIDDPDDELKGVGLTALWPDLISTTDMFAQVREPKDPSLHGLYQVFLDTKLLQEMSVADLPIGLAWHSRQPQRLNSLGAISRLMDNIVKLAWKNMDIAGVTSGLATACLSRIRLHDEFVSRFYDDELRRMFDSTSDERRHRLLEELLPQLKLENITALYMLHVRLIDYSDFDWLLARITEGVSPVSIVVEARILSRLLGKISDRQATSLWHACESIPALKSECGALFDPVPLDSELARTLRENWKWEKETPAPLDPPPKQRIDRDLQRLETGEMAGWVDLTFDLTLEPTSSHYNMDLDPDLTNTPGWKQSGTDTKSRILSAALRYLGDAILDNGWFSTSTIPYTATSGFQALALLETAQDKRLDSLPSSAWTKWVPILLRYPSNRTTTKQIQQTLLRRAHAVVPDQVIDRVLQRIDIDNDAGGYLILSPEIELLWNERLGTAILEKVRGSRLKSTVMGSLLGILLSHDIAGARELAESIASLPLFEGGQPQQRPLAAILALLNNTADADWPVVWSTIQGNTDAGRAIIESVAYANFGNNYFIEKLSEDNLADLYVWMVRTYPHNQFALGAGFGFIGAARSATILRDSILEHLKARRNFAACDAIRRAMEALPECPWIRGYLDDAEVLARAATWVPITPTAFLNLAHDVRKRTVDSGNQLLDVVLESLERLQVKLQGELPAAKDLWNRALDGSFTPKDEQDLSDYVTRHLKDDLRDRGVIVNREVQIRRGIGNGTGQSTDVHVDTPAPKGPGGPYELICVIIEAKGNWHPELFSAMSTQLRNRYLRDNQCTNGIYLVGWFSCAKWSDSDKRKSSVPKMSLEEVTDRLSSDARRLSDGYLIKSYVLNIRLT